MQEQTQVTDITELNFSACGIQKLYPGELEMFPNLEVLHLDNNRIYQVPKGFAVSHPSLQTLTLSGNKMQEVQEGAIIDCRELTALGVGNNNLCELRPDQVGAPYLQYLDTCLNRHLDRQQAKGVGAYVPTSESLLPAGFPLWCHQWPAPLRHRRDG